MSGTHTLVPCSICGVILVRRGRVRCWKCYGFEDGTPQERFNRKWRIEPNGCWEWQGARDRHGYGDIRGLGQKKAHRLSWVIHFGAIPPITPDVLHECDNPRCVNPGHLFLGTQADNNRDRDRKRRHAHGERSPHARLKEAEALTILKSKEDSKSLASRYGISVAQVNKIRRGAKWAHLQMESAT